MRYRCDIPAIPIGVSALVFPFSSHMGAYDTARPRKCPKSAPVTNSCSQPFVRDDAGCASSDLRKCNRPSPIFAEVRSPSSPHGMQCCLPCQGRQGAKLRTLCFRGRQGTLRAASRIVVLDEEFFWRRGSGSNSPPSLTPFNLLIPLYARCALSARSAVSLYKIVYR